MIPEGKKLYYYRISILLIHTSNEYDFDIHIILGHT